MRQISYRLSLKSRLTRGKFWFLCIAVWALLYAFTTIIGTGISSDVVTLLNAPFLVVLVILCVRRLHDRSLSGWWILIVGIPILGAIWLTWQLAIKAGVNQANQWGEDPHINTADYLVVR